MVRGTGGGWTRDRKLGAVCAAVAVVVIGAGVRGLQLSWAHQEWAVAHPAEWRVQFPDEAAAYQGTPPAVSPYWLFVFLCVLLTIVVLAFVGGFYGWRNGNDAPHFEDQDEEEQGRRVGAGASLHQGLAGAPTVANTVATRAGRRAGRATAREARRSRPR